MDENPEGERVLDHCESLPGPDLNPRGPSRTPQSQSRCSQPSFPQIQGREPHSEHLGHFPHMMSCKPSQLPFRSVVLSGPFHPGGS